MLKVRKGFLSKGVSTTVVSTVSIRANAAVCAAAWTAACRFVLALHVDKMQRCHQGSSKIVRDTFDPFFLVAGIAQFPVKVFVVGTAFFQTLCTEQQTSMVRPSVGAFAVAVIHFGQIVKIVTEKKERDRG